MVPIALAINRRSLPLHVNASRHQCLREDVGVSLRSLRFVPAKDVPGQLSSNVHNGRNKKPAQRLLAPPELHNPRNRTSARMTKSAKHTRRYSMRTMAWMAALSVLVPAIFVVAALHRDPAALLERHPRSVGTENGPESHLTQQQQQQPQQPQFARPPVPFSSRPSASSALLPVRPARGLDLRFMTLSYWTDAFGSSARAYDDVSVPSSKPGEPSPQTSSQPAPSWGPVSDYLQVEGWSILVHFVGSTAATFATLYWMLPFFVPRRISSRKDDIAFLSSV
ncbi:uncharacterized protein BJ171DRAFT_609939 [Polychytrium aggregatum]|uniref:uncharacterized protein n=1 Tax=Polychytrium aggregatum TaxID=110093 RepID=UPI0022FDEAF6|nr:uncharacterized protein BJ171DRAFT_609939 [Polychytrium aggregatum]KAI9206719.1 hypothetical protein BJ171DRAFT_609939 [Polychytrium aggregatum]